MNEQSVDEAILNELRAIMGSDFGLLIEVFISDSIQRITLIQNTIAANEAEGLRRAAHSLKGSAMNISAGKLTELCQQLEFMGRDRKLDGAQEVLEAVKTEFSTVKDYLESL